jgi:hypothetical protein
VAKLGLIAAGPRSAAEIAAHSRAALDRPLALGHDAELWVGVATDAARSLGAFQRLEARAGGPAAVVRRGSGGPEVLIGPGTVHVALSLAHPGSLAACDEKRIVNRYVRPLLRALTASGSTSAFFGRDWISVSKHPAGWVGFAHDATTRRTLFEAFVAVSAPFVSPERVERSAFRGRAPATLESIAGRAMDARRIAQAVVAAYSEGLEVFEVDAGPGGDKAVDGAGLDTASDPPWAATIEEAIGLIGAGPDSRGVFRVGGDLMASRDAVARLEGRAAVASEGEMAAIVDETLTAPGVVIEGVRELGSFREVIARARGWR